MTAPFAADYIRRALSEIAAALPGATEILRRHKLDFCCGGRATLAEAAAAKGLDAALIAAELAGLAARGGPPAPPWDVSDLIALIERRYHADHRRDIVELVRLAGRVEAVHAAHPKVPVGLTVLLRRIELDLEEHMRKEEAVLFPLMRGGGHAMIAGPLRVMLAEHQDHGAYVQALAAMTDDFTPPPDACTTWRALYAAAHKFTVDLTDHIHLENNVLFPRFLA